MKLVFLVLAVGLADASPLKDKVCQPHSRPWQVYLHGAGMTCSGALVNEWWIVTSFNCALSSSGTVASLGDHDVTAEEGTEQRIRVADVILHSPYRSPLHSLAMVRLAEPARINEYVKLISLPNRCPQPGDTCYVSGWGSTTSDQYEPAQLLKCITVPVVGDQTCMNTFPEFLFWSPTMVCAGQENTDNCLRDGGSAMVCDDQLQGVQWYGNGCSNPSHPTVYTKLCKYNDWINDVMGRYTTTEPSTSTRNDDTRQQRRARHN